MVTGHLVLGPHPADHEALPEEQEPDQHHGDQHVAVAGQVQHQRFQGDSRHVHTGL